MRLLAAAAVPVIVLTLAELALRLVGFGYPTGFLLPSENHGQKTYVQNNAFGWRFFGKRKSRAPDAISMLQDKPRGTIRIFVFGESAAFGDPQPAFGLPRVLQATLSLRHPDLKFEVINAAMTAIDSHVILPIARDCARASGDIWVIYMGNNEVVGPFGAGTVFGSQAPPLPLVRASLALRTTRLGQLIDAAGERWREPSTNNREWGGMQMFLDQQVREDDPRLTTVYRSFERNLSDIIRVGHESGAGVVVSTVAVNLKDCAPFASQGGKLDERLRLEIQSKDAERILENAAQTDPNSAEIQFCLGRSLLASGDIARGQKALISSRDLDTLRFRCDGRLNEIIRRMADGREGEKVLLSDAERAFADASPDGVPGWNFFYEHVHLTFEGNCLLARTLAEKIEKLLPQNPATGNHAWPTAVECALRLGRTDRDLHAALVEILTRLHDPPFATQANNAEQVQYLTGEARKAQSRASLPDALRAVRAALEAAPEDAQLYAELAALERDARHLPEAEAAARHALELIPSSEDYWSQLGFCLVHEKKFDDALNAFRRASDLNSQDVFPMQNVAMAMAKLGRKQDAVREYERAVAMTPRFGMAWMGLGQLFEEMGRGADATNCYQKALQFPVHTASELTTVARFCFNRGWLAPAVTNFDEAVKLDPSDPALSLEAGQAHFQFGMELGKAGQTASAAHEFQDAVRLMPDIVEARLNLGIALYRMGQLSESLAEFQQVTARSPTNALAQHYLDLLGDRRATPGQN